MLIGNNILLCTDVYKMGHMEQYPPDITKIYSYLTARSGKVMDEVLFYGLQYYLKMLEQPIYDVDVDEFLNYRQRILGTPAPDHVVEKLRALADLQYIPLHIKAVPEGTVLPVKNVLMTVTNTHKDFAWVVGFFESLLLKVWYPTTVASYSLKLKKLCEEFANRTCDDHAHMPFQVHDFGYRGCSSEESAAIGGSAHLINFLGTDTIPAVQFVNNVYGVKKGTFIGLSVPASEHSVMCAYGEDGEIHAFRRMLELYPKGIVSIVSDTYNLWKVLTDYADYFGKEILARDGKVVFRPDSGDPLKIICGDESAALGSPERQGCLELLGERFGFTVNSKGYKVLNPKVGLIYGDGFYYERFRMVLERMEALGWASSNLVVGMGGLLLQQHSRDTMGFAIKATYAEYKDGGSRELCKDPITDPGKKSLRGMMALHHSDELGYHTLDSQNKAQEEDGLLKTVFKDGWIKATTFDKIRQRATCQ